MDVVVPNKHGLDGSDDSPAVMAGVVRAIFGRAHDGAG
jgi:hypothetical protein